jgi:hypothetical protein
MCLVGGFGANIIMKKLNVQLGLSKPKPTPYNLSMVDQIIFKPLGLIKDIKILVHGIPYTLTFTMIQSSVLNFSNSMLLGRPWLRDVKVFHDWSNNTITLQRTNTIKTRHVTKKLGVPIKHPKVLVCYDFHFGIFDEKEDLMFATKLGLFSIGTTVVLI